jgi:hypothetical protein
MTVANLERIPQNRMPEGLSSAQNLLIKKVQQFAATCAVPTKRI